MVSTFSQNIGLELPANGDYVNTWSSPVNTDWSTIDSCFGGVTTLNAVAASGVVALTVAQYRPRTIVITGALTANVNYQLPTGVGGFWSIFNNTSGAFTITFSSAGGGTSGILRQGYRTFVGSNGTDTYAWATNPQLAAGSTTQIQYNNAGDFGASSDLTWDNTGKTLTVNGNLLLSRATPTVYFNTGGPRMASTAANTLSFYKDALSNEVFSIASNGTLNYSGARTNGSAVTIPGSGNVRVEANVAGGYALSTFDTQDYTAVQFVRLTSGVPVENGTITVGTSSVSYNTVSDERAKTGFRDFNSGSIIDALWVGAFDFRAGGSGHGVRAQQAHTVFPDAVTPGAEPEDMWSVDYSKFVPVLLAEVKSLRERVARLESGGI